MTTQPSTPVKVPPSAASYTAATLDPDLRSNINARLIIDGHVAKIQEHLLHALNAHSSNWPAAVQDHAVALLRSGDVSSFPALLKRVLDDVRADTLLPKQSSSSAAANGEPSSSAAGGGAAPSKKVNGSSGAGAGAAPSLALPKAVVDDAVRVARECLEAVIEVDDHNGSS